MLDENSQRIDRLESHIAHLEHQVDQLNGVVIEQGNRNHGGSSAAVAGVDETNGRTGIGQFTKDRVWLARLTNALNQHWQRKNSVKKEAALGSADKP